MITSKSRYMTGRVVPQPKSSTVAVHRIFTETSDRYALYTWKSSDRIDRIAARYLGDPAQWWRILDANSSIQNVSDIRPGMQVRIPTNA
jgi:nucleoid-associated protein YgaU